MGQYFVGLVGESNYQAAIRKLKVGDRVALEHEPTNAFDRQAVRALSPAGETIGYLARDHWLRESVWHGAPVQAAVKQISGSRGKLGVVLNVATGKSDLRGGVAAINRVAAFVRGVARGLRGGAVIAAVLSLGALDQARAAPASGALTIDWAHVAASAKAECPAKHPDNLALQGGCRRNYESGAASIAEIAERHRASARMQAALRRCLRTYTVRGFTNYAIAGGCARNQERGQIEMER